MDHDVIPSRSSGGSQGQTTDMTAVPEPPTSPEEAPGQYDRVSISSGSANRDIWRTTNRLAVGFWATYFVMTTVLYGIAGVDPVKSMPGKIVAISALAVMTHLMSWCLLKLRRLRLARKAQVAFAMSLVLMPVVCALDHVIHVVSVYPEPVALNSTYLAYVAIETLAVLFGWSCLFLAVLYSHDVLERERQLAAAREEALTAQMQALRYQVNPHFLFNTLNSVTGLIEEGAVERARSMVLSLSTFMRTTLTLNPLQKVSLGDELALQEDYLLVERERFHDRMAIRIDIRDSAEIAVVPPLILQPLVENAMKHGVGMRREPVEIMIAAWRRDDRLILRVENDTNESDHAEAPQGTGTGQKNVTERIRGAYGDAARVAFGLCAPRRYRAELDLPWTVI